MESKNTLLDAELAAQLFEGDKGAFDEIYKRYWKHSYNEAYKRLRSATQCEEVIQDVFTSLWINREKRKIDNMAAYLSTAVRYQVFMLYKKGKKMPVFEEPQEYMAETSLRADSKLNVQELRLAIERWLATQPEKRREIFKMRFMEELSTKEISEILGISQKTVQNQLTTATRQLRDSIDGLLTLSIIFLIMRG